MALLSEQTQFVRQVWKIDRVVLAIAVIIVILIVLVPEQIWQSAIFTGEALVGIGPFLIMSVLVAAFAKATGLDKQIAIAFSGHPVRAVFFAAAFGALSPFCSCGVVRSSPGCWAPGYHWHR